MAFARVVGVGTAEQATEPITFKWCNNNFCGLTLSKQEGITLNPATGIFTVKPGYGGRYRFTWNASLYCDGGVVHQFQFLSPATVVPTVKSELLYRAPNNDRLCIIHFEDEVDLIANADFAIQIVAPKKDILISKCNFNIRAIDVIQ